MAVRMEKPWIDLTPEAAKALPGQLGVYQLADAAGRIVYIGFAGGRSLFGLRSELQRALARPAWRRRAFPYRGQPTIHVSPLHPLLMLHVADHGSLPTVNQADPPPRLGRLQSVVKWSVVSGQW